MNYGVRAAIIALGLNAFGLLNAPVCLAAPPLERTVYADRGNIAGGAWGPDHDLADALRREPHATRFQIRWELMFGSLSSAAVVVYNRPAHTLKLRCIGGHNDKSWLFTQVSDVKLLKLAKDYPGGTRSMSSGFDKLSLYGCKKYKIAPAYFL